METLYHLFLKHPQICTDTRKIIPDSLFFALKGPNFNANQLAKEALEKGCAYAIIDEASYAISERCIVVEDVLTTLQQLANYHRKQLTIPILALTGSNGKTTTKELIHVVMNKKFNTLATSGNLNNHIGVPLTLLSITKEHEFAIIEMGANHQLEIKQLSEIAEPNFGMITNIGKAHIEGFGGVEGIKKGKGELFDHLRKANNLVFVNGNDATLMQMSAGMNRFFYGSNEACDFSGKFLDANPFLRLELESSKLIIQTHLVGAYNFDNVLAAIAIGNYFGIRETDAKSAIESYHPDNNRSQIIEKNGRTIIMDAYNANPSSMTVALENFAKLKAEYKLAIVGDMFEMGDAEKEEHEKIIQLASKLNLNCIFVGKAFYNLKSNAFQFFITTDEAKSYLNNLNTDKTTLLIKGSRGMKMETLLDSL